MASLVPSEPLLKQRRRISSSRRIFLLLLLIFGCFCFSNAFFVVLAAFAATTTTTVSSVQRRNKSFQIRRIAAASYAWKGIRRSCDSRSRRNTSTRATNNSNEDDDTQISSLTAIPLFNEDKIRSSRCKNDCGDYLGYSNGTSAIFDSKLSYGQLLSLQPGSYIESKPISITMNNNDDDKIIKSVEYCVQFYPRGTKASDNKKSLLINTNQGFGMSYAMNDPNNENEKVGIYLKLLGCNKKLTGDLLDYVDTSFGLRMKGKQYQSSEADSKRPQVFDVEWRGGIRFIPITSNKRQRRTLTSGYANDFGSSMMQTVLLKDFLGVNDENYFDAEITNVDIQVDILVHKYRAITISNGEQQQQRNNVGVEPDWKKWFSIQDIRTSKSQQSPTNVSDYNVQTSTARHNQNMVRVGKIVTPVLQKLSQRNDMFAKGVYPGVEYRILRILAKEGDTQRRRDIFYSESNAEYELKPIYPLVSQLERQWPVRINEREIPKLVTPGMYNVVSAVGSLFTAITCLVAAFVVSQAISFFYIPSKSMDPTLQVGDVLLVEKITPKLKSTFGGDSYQPGDVVLFHPPESLSSIVKSSGGRISDRDLFVKRIAAGPGATVTVDTYGGVVINGGVDQQPNDDRQLGKKNMGRRDLCDTEPLGLIRRLVSVGTSTIPDHNYEVLGDCSSVSIDSRVWGPLQENYIVGRPIVRIWPKFGAIPALPTTASSSTEY